MVITKIDNMLKHIKKFQNSDIQDFIDMTDEIEYLINMQYEINSYKPKIAVIGEFSSGKSTLINSFLGIDLLPAKYIPTTSYITNIEYSEDEYIEVDGERIELLKDNIEKIENVKNKEINIFLNNSILKEFSFIDTPGTNDPSKFSDDIVFSMIGDVDIVMFIFNSAAALKDTEKNFISKLIKQKDLNKFFFIFNKSDTVENAKHIKENSLNILSNMLNLNRETLNKQSLAYSSIDVLERKIKAKESQVFELLKDKLKNYIKINHQALLDEWVNVHLQNIVNSISLKLDLLIDQINDDTAKYQTNLNDLNKQISDFELEIETSILKTILKFNEYKQDFIIRIDDNIKYIKSTISTEISDMSMEQLYGSRYIELRTKKLVEDKTEEAYILFINAIGSLIDDFDKKIEKNNFIKQQMNIDTIKNTNTVVKVVNGTALIATTTGLVSAAPMATTALASVAGMASFGALSPALLAIPAVGPLLSGIAVVSGAAVPIIGVVALAAGKVLFDIGKWGVGIIGKGGKIIEEKAKRSRYIKEVHKSLDIINKQILEEIDKINLDHFKDNYIEQKFPQKIILEDKIILDKKNQNLKIKISNEKVEHINNFKEDIFKLAGEKNV